MNSGGEYIAFSCVLLTPGMGAEVAPLGKGRLYIGNNEDIAPLDTPELQLSLKNNVSGLFVQCIALA